MKNIRYNYLWYPLTNLVEVDNSKLIFVVSQIISPYIELNMEDMNKIDGNSFLEEKIIEINPLLRFENIFEELEHPDLKNYNQEVRGLLTNIILHLIGLIDLYTGQNKKDIIIKEIVKDIKEGAFGKEIKALFKNFKEYEKYVVADVLYSMYNKLGLIESFKKAFKMIFSDSIIYNNISSTTNIVIYLNYVKNKSNLNKVKLLKELFLPLGLKIDLFWINHFGVIGVSSTMRIGEISVF
ncbi:MAG: hypothetical protein ACRC0S_08340 [Fusobacteriaceae bacterium]